MDTLKQHRSPCAILRKFVELFEENHRMRGAMPRRTLTERLAFLEEAAVALDAPAFTLDTIRTALNGLHMTETAGVPEQRVHATHRTKPAGSMALSATP